LSARPAEYNFTDRALSYSGHQQIAQCNLYPEQACDAAKANLTEADYDTML